MEKVGRAGDDGIKTAKISGNSVTGEYFNGGKYKTAIPVNYPDLYGKLLEKNVAVEVVDLSKNEWISWLLQLLSPIPQPLRGLWQYGASNSNGVHRCCLIR